MNLFGGDDKGFNGVPSSINYVYQRTPFQKHCKVISIKEKT